MGFNANVLKMDKFGNVKPFTFILSTKNYKHLGQLNNVKIETIDFKCNLNGANELSFELYKKIEDEVEKLWDDITDLKSIYVPELDEYFEIQVAYNDKLEETKTVICKSLCESELSQTYMYGTEINTQTDSDRLDYSQTIFYDELNPKGSLLHRVLSFVPQYKIKHVDASLCKLQRSFSIDGTNVYDFLTGECAEQFNCLFVFDSTNRSISAYDLYTSCNECGHRDAYSFVCPKCGSTNINYFGNDTDVYIDKENFSDDIKLEVDVDSIKNCLRLRSGDDIMDEAIISMNPNGTRYIYYISDEQREDMSDELVNKIDEYDKLVEQYTPEYQDLALDVRELTDRKTYYESTMMPSPIDDDEEVPGDSISSKELAKLTQEKLSPVGMDELSTAITLDTVDIVVKNYAKVFVNSSLVKIDIVEGSTFTYKGKDKDDWDYGIWTGKIKLVAYSDANDVAITDTFTLTIHDNYGEFLQQKVMKEMALNDKEGSVFNVLDIEDFDEFKLVLKEYCLSRLRSFHMALDTACTTLVSLDQATENADWYEDIYVPYHNKLLACSNEIIVRESQIKEIQDQLNILYARKSEIQSILNFENFLGEDLYIEFCTYRREGEYHNDNYISDGLSNAEIIDRAKEFIEVAKKELIRSATKKYTISTNLHNLLLMKEFKPLANKFALGNFIRVRVGKDLFRLRLNSYHLTFSDLSTIDVEFSDMTKSINVIDATQKILSDAQSMASNISYISKQAEKGEKANESVNNIVQNGLDSALTQIKNNVNQEFVIDNNGILGRRYNDITGKYEPEQVRITNNILAYSSDGFKTVRAALGKHDYYKFVDGELGKYTAYGLVSDFVTSGVVYGSQIISGDIFSENYSPTTGTHIALNDGSFNFGHKIIYDAETNKVTMKDVTIEWDSTNPPKKSDIEGLEDYLEQLDGRIQTYSQPTDPSINWKTSEDKAKHDGDIWFDTTNGLTKRWNNTTGKWDIVTDSEIKSLAQSKAQIFTSQPVPPYSVGDLWVEGKDGDIWHCMVNKKKGESFEKNDWLISSKYTDDSAFNAFVNGEYADDLKEVYSQIDKKAETWYQSTDPSVNWTTDNLKKNHVGDLWYNTSEHKNYVYSSSYKWDEIDGVPDDVFDKIDTKAQIFATQPIPPYYVNDLYVQGSNGDIYVCKTERLEGVYKESDWVKASKYTDNSELYSFIEDDYAKDLEDISTQIDGKARAWYQSEDPSLTWDKNENHEGDLWYDTDANSQVTSIYHNNAWKATSVPKSLFDTIDGIASIYVTMPSKPQVGDLLIPTANIGTTYKAGKVYKYNGTSWVEIAYTDDTKANEALDAASKAQLTANSAMGVAENAETIGNNLVNVLGYDGTKIANTHIYSPVISGGSILVGNKTGTYAEITTEGILNCKGANVSGDIIANSLTLGSGVTIPSTSIDGLDSTIKGYGYQTKTETKKIVESYGYQTSDDVTSLITSYGYKNADEVKGIVEGYGYTTNSAAYKYLLDGSYFLVSGTKISEITGYTEFANSLVLKSSISSTTSTETLTLPSGEKVNRTTYTTTVPNSNGTFKTFKTYDDGAYVFTNIGIGNGSSDPANSTSADTYVMIDKNGCLTADNAVIRGNIYAINGYFNGTVHATDGEFTGDITATSGKITGNLNLGGSLTNTKGNYTVTLRGVVENNPGAGVFFITDKSSGSNAYPFILNGDGSFIAKKANITGSITATSGTMDSVTATNLTVTSGTIKLGDATLSSTGLTINSSNTGSSTIAGWKLLSNKITKNTVGISHDSGNYAFWAGGTESGTDPNAGIYHDSHNPAFAVRQNGEVIATKGRFGNLGINSDGDLGGSGTNHMMLYPNGYKYNDNSNIFFIVLYKNGQRYKGLSLENGWVNF